MFWLVVLATVVVLAGGAYYWFRSRGSGDETRITCRCPKCDRKIRYPASQVGHFAICRGCKHRVPLPYESEDGEGEPKKKVDDYRVRRKLDKADNAERT